ncbi:MAG TPA: hypothetical protein VLI90_19295, partial [Tepidisphaeraceae bacterium]|nr:hypothetical protein [Tepidisphaeraceae bacterium]
VDVLLDGGRVEIWDSHAGAPPRTQIHRWQIFWGFRLRLPDVRRSAWEFDAHALGNAKLGRLYLIAFPIWCALLPCLIAPALWWRDHRRRGRAEQRGFPLDAVALAATSPA